MLKLRRAEPGQPLIVSMAGLRLGDSVLFLGCRDPKAIAQLAVKPGLSGRICAVDDDRGRADAAGHAAQAEGALVETTVAPLSSLPFDRDSFDVVVAIRLLRDFEPGARSGAFGEAWRVVRPGGRCVVIEEGSRKGFAGLFPTRAPFPAPEIVSLLEAAGFRGVRTLADRDRLLFLEGARAK